MSHNISPKVGQESHEKTDKRVPTILGRIWPNGIQKDGFYSFIKTELQLVGREQGRYQEKTRMRVNQSWERTWRRILA